MSSRDLYDQGKQMAALGLFVDAADLLRRSLDLDPDHGPTRFEFAKALGASGKEDEAFVELGKVLAWVPSHPGAVGMRLDILISLLRYEEAYDWSESYPQILESRARKVAYTVLLYQLGYQNRYEAYCAELSAREFKRVRELIVGADSE